MLEGIILAGFGGQGVMFAGQLLAYTAMDEGLEVTWIPSYGPEMRGGTAHCLTMISDRPIASPLMNRSTAAVVFNNPSFDKYEREVAVGGLLVVNTSLIARTSTREDITVLNVPATEIASKLGDARVTNMVLLGAMLAARPIMPVAALERALEHHIPKNRRNLIPMNLQAIAHGVEAAQAVMV